MEKIIAFIFLLNILHAEAQRLPAHAHNHYLNERPLFDALEANFRSIEADVFAIGDSLFVAHDFDKIQPGNTLRKMYLNPLMELFAKNKSSEVTHEQEVILLVDIKDDGLETYKLLVQILENYREMLSIRTDNRTVKGSVTVIVSGNRPLDYLMSQTEILAFYDGRLTELDTGLPNHIMPLVSDNWNRYFKWNGKGVMPSEEKEKLLQLVHLTHSKGCMLRFWATPERSELERQNVWQELIDAKVDLIGTDDIQDLKDFLNLSKKNQNRNK